VSAVYRDASRSELEHAARADGYTAGYAHQNYVTAYGPTPGTTLPDRFADVAAVWHDAYQDGRDDYDAELADAEAFGHDWRQHEPVELD
jgi:hypothetical protein